VRRGRVQIHPAGGCDVHRLLKVLLRTIDADGLHGHFLEQESGHVHCRRGLGHADLQELAASAGNGDSVTNGRLSAGGFENDRHTVPAGGVENGLHGVRVLDVNHLETEALGDLEAYRAHFGDQDPACAGQTGHLRGKDSDRPGAEHSGHIAHLQVRGAHSMDGHCERFDDRGLLQRDGVGHRIERVPGDDGVLGKAAVRVDADQFERRAHMRAARPAGVAVPAGDQRVDRYPRPGRVRPAVRVRHRAGELVAGHQRRLGAHVLAEVDHHIGSADAAVGNPNERLTRGRRWPRNLGVGDLFRSHPERGSHHFGHSSHSLQDVGRYTVRTADSDALTRADLTTRSSTRPSLGPWGHCPAGASSISTGRSRIGAAVPGIH